ncbi:unnamed protein product [Parnassius apollo]|uniref:(apollo) hypothetical protein n=1 Tax=Parnassius apollo TaxID=110799 RepID=A0A8S3WM06_PARAO|nr:unnamed protein product [Parnassius apollo]
MLIANFVYWLLFSLYTNLMMLRVIGVTAITGSQAIQEAGFQEPSQPQVSNTADRILSPAEIELLELPSAAEDTPITVPANVTSPPAHPVSPVPPSNSRTIQ